MKTTTFNQCRRLRAVSPRPALLAAFSLLAAPGLSASAQDKTPAAATPAATPQANQAAQPPTAPQTNQTPQPPGTSPATAPATQTPPAGSTAPQTPGSGPPPASIGGPRTPTPPDLPQVEIQNNGQYLYGGNIVHMRGGVTVTYAGTTLVADNLDGNINGELVFTGHAHIARPGGIAYADAIHFTPRDGRFSLDNPRGILDPSLLEGQIYQPVYLSGGQMFGNRTGYSIADQIIATTCDEHFHHYELRIANAELIPHKRIILRRVGVVFFGVKLITLPTIIIPLDKEPGRRPRTDYLPEFGQNYDEGYFARFPYTFAEGSDAATFVRADITQKRGLGYRFEQEYLAGKQDNFYNTSGAGYGGGFGTTGSNGALSSAYGYGTLGAGLPRLGTGVGPQNGGLFAIQGYFADGFNRNFNGSFRHQQSIGGSNRFDFSTEIQRNSFFVLGGSNTSSTAQTTRFDFAHNDAAHGVNDDLSLSLATSNNTGSASNQLTGTLKQNYIFASGGTTRNSLAMNIDFSHLLNTYSSGTGPEQVTRSERLNPQFDLQHVARDWSWDLNANKSIPIGFQSGNSNFGTLEKLPELMLSTDTYNYRGGWLRNIPSSFQFGVGQYSEPATNTMTDRVLLAWNVQPFSVIRGRTELVTAAGIEQHIYGDGAADYIVRNTTQMRQHLGGRSGIDFNYDYEQPEGGTPFLFDQFRRAHNISAQAGYLDDKNFQLTARVGYDLLGGNSLTPWQSLSTNLMWRPTPSVRFDLSSTYDPNQGKFFSFTNIARFRAKNDFALDLVTRIDPNQPGIRRKFSQINTQFSIPIGHRWRVTGLLNYSGLSGQFESRNVQIAHDWDCMEATFTYTETIGSFRPDRQFYLAIRIKAFPFFRAFNRGPAGEGLGTGVGNLY